MRLGAVPLLGCLVLCASIAESQPVEIASDLKEPAAIAHVPGPAGGFRLLVAEAGGGLTEFTLLGEGVLSRRAINRAADAAVVGPVVGLGSYEERAVVVAAGGGRLVPMPADAAGLAKPLTVVEEAAGLGPWIGPPTLSDRWLFVPARDGLLRGRLLTGRVMAMRRRGPAVLAVSLVPAGYLATLDPAGDGGVALSYRDPSEPEKAIASYPIDGLSGVLALAVRPTDSSLYALQPGSNPTVSGLFRLDVSDPGDAVPGPIRVVATRITAPAGVTAMAFGPKGRLYVTTESGELVRLNKAL